EQDDFGYAAQGATAGYRYQTQGAQGAVATAAYPAVTNGYGGYVGAADDFDGRDGYGQDGYGYARSSVGYAEPQGGYAEPQDGYAEPQDGYADTRDGYEWGAPDGYADGAYLGPGSYVEPGAVRAQDPGLTAPDAGVHPDRWQAEQAGRREARRRGLMVGAVSELLAVGVVLG